MFLCQIVTINTSSASPVLEKSAQKNQASILLSNHRLKNAEQERVAAAVQMEKAEKKENKEKRKEKKSESGEKKSDSGTGEKKEKKDKK